MTAYADYPYYVDAFGGTAIAESDFPALAGRASAQVDAATRGRAERTSGAARLAVQNAVCALAEVLQDERRMDETSFRAGGGVNKESVGSWSRTCEAGPSAAGSERIEARKREALAVYLAGTGLLRAGAYRARGERGCFRTR